MSRLTLAALRLLCRFHPDGHDWTLVTDERRHVCVKCKAVLR